jgi:hypothetical protein
MKLNMPSSCIGHVLSGQPQKRRFTPRLSVARPEVNVIRVLLVELSASRRIGMFSPGRIYGVSIFLVPEHVSAPDLFPVGSLVLAGNGHFA